MEAWFLDLQAFQVVFLWLHDWVPLGPLNDTAAVRRVHPAADLVRATLLQSIPFTIGLAFSARYYGRDYPGWVAGWLWISYGWLLWGEVMAWWVPYLMRPEPERARRYRRMFGRTHHFLPEKNGMVPNTLHVLLHVTTVLTLVLLFLRQSHS